MSSWYDADGSEWQIEGRNSIKERCAPDEP